MTVEEAIQKHGALAVYEAAGEADRGNNCDPLRNLGLTVETPEDVSRINLFAYLVLWKKEQWEIYQKSLKRIRPEAAASRNKDWLARIDRELALSPEQLQDKRSGPAVRMCR